MIASIRAEWRKNRFRPALLVAMGLIAGLTVLVYSSNWYLATHPGAGERAISITALYPDQFVNNVMGAGFPLGAAMAIVLGAILAGSEYSWGTLKTLFTQGPGRLTTWVGRMAVFTVWMGILTAILFVFGAGYSALIALVNGHTVVWPAAADIAKGFGAIWLIFLVNGAIGMALGVLARQSAAAIGIGVVYLLSVEIIAVRFIDSVSNGDYKWVGNLFVGQNANALIAHLSGAPTHGISISAEQAVLVMFAWLAGLLAVAAGLQRVRDVT
jgi:ABC-type transport system involved in multi-copper enzyme maturation permease subunit